MTGELNGLREVASQLQDLASNAHTSTCWLEDGNAEVGTKLTEAASLCLHLASLRAHRLQTEMAQDLGVFST